MRYHQLVGSLAALGAIATAGVDAFVKGHDLSSVGIMETQQGATWFTSSGKASAIENILGDGGMNSVRLRIWTSGDYGLNYTLGMAQRFSKAGYSIYLDMHFSDTWADADTQQTPSAWSSSPIKGLASNVRSYVSSTLQSFTDGGVDIAVLALGNEITSGMLYPLGKISNDDFSGFATLWAAARAGVDDAVKAGTAKPEVMIHLDNGWKEETVSWFFKTLFATGTVTTDDVDVFGFSFYPFYSTDATINALSSSLSSLASTYGKPIYVAETDYPTSCPSVELSASYPVSAQGQIEWTQAVIGVLEDLPNGLGAGLYYWEPGYIAKASLGSSCESALLFSVDWTKWPHTSATALSSVSLFK